MALEVVETRQIVETAATRTPADGTASGIRVFGRMKKAVLIGAFGGGSVQLKIRESHSIPWRNLGTAQTSAGVVDITDGFQGFIDMALTGATAPSITLFVK